MERMSEYITMRDCPKLDLEDAVSQRDQAREAFAIATNNCVDAQQRLREMERELNEAREALKQ
jgi:K+/H+ antiporter YhaU regulatory subunit KhtT